MNAKDLAQYLDRTGFLILPRTDVRPAIVVLDARPMFGRTELLVKPVAGDGEGWYALGTVKLDPPKLALRV